MTPATVSDRMREVVRSLGRTRVDSDGGRSNVRMFWRRRLPPIEQLLIVPPDLRSADPGFLVEIADGAFGLGGVSLHLVDGSPFRVAAAAPAWERELHGFGWLRNFATDRTPVMAEQARAFVLEWIAMNGGKRPVAWRAEIQARRVLSWLAHAEVILDGADQPSYDAIMMALAVQVAELRRTARKLPPGLPRLNAAIALLQAYVSLPQSDAERAIAELRLTTEIENQILADGGHISRDPGVLVEILLDLVPLRQCFVARRLTCPEAIMSAIRRMIPMLRHMRMGDGSIARFNGMGVTMPDALATALAYDSNYTALPSLAPDSRYARLDSGGTIAVMDTGTTPPSAHGLGAHAGCLSFELSAGRCPIFVNAGVAPQSEHRARAAPPRATSSHSSLVIAESSSAIVTDRRRSGRLDGAARLQGAVEAAFNADADALTIAATHAGYGARFGLFHRRQLSLCKDGAHVDGIDQLLPVPGRQPASQPYAIHFHLHPSVDVRMGWGSGTVLLTLADGAQWRFTCANATLSIEESAHHALGAGSRRSLQLVLRRVTCTEGSEVQWTLVRISEAKPVVNAGSGAEAVPRQSLADALSQVAAMPR